jgi:hypothetical protein
VRPVNFIHYHSALRRVVLPTAFAIAPDGIYVSTVVEDGVRKFDGYCPEPSMAESFPAPR